MGNTHTKSRNSLSAEKVTRSALLKMDVIRKRKAMESFKCPQKKSQTLSSSPANQAGTAGIPEVLLPLIDEDDDLTDTGIENLIDDLWDLNDYGLDEQISGTDFITLSSFLKTRAE